MPKVLIADKINDVCKRILEEKGIEVDVNENPSPEELVDVIHKYDGIVVRSATKLKDPNLFETAAGNLQIIGRAGAGVDTIDLDLANKYGIMVVNTPTSNSVSVAELVFAHILALSRNISFADSTTKGGMFDKGPLGKTGMEIYGKTIGIIGLGNIGRLVAKRAEAFDMNVIYHDPYVTSDYKSVSLDELFKQSDIVTVHAPNIPETRGMITKDLLLLLKENSIFINTARVNVIDGNALYETLEAREDIRVGIDVYGKDEAQEQPLSLFKERVILTPHIGGSTPEAQVRGAEGIAKQFIEFFEHGRAEHSVNFTAIPEEVYPFLELTERLALMGSHLIDSQANTIEISCYGSLNQHSELLSRAAVKGVLQFNTDMFINYINAPHVAEERGIKINVRTPDDAKDYGDAVTVDLVVNGKRTSIRGNLDYDKQPVASRVDNIFIEIPLEDSSFFIYKDSPGIVGAIGTVCGNERVNLEVIRTGRHEVRKGIQKTVTGRYPEETAAMTVISPALDLRIMDKIFRDLSHRAKVYNTTNVKF